MTRGPIVLAPTSPVTRCPGCGGWVWVIKVYGCNTCRAYWATYGVAPTDSHHTKEIA
jgi:ABC-type thiamine transport system substrate-binding protein